MKVSASLATRPDGTPMRIRRSSSRRIDSTYVVNGARAEHFRQGLDGEAGAAPDFELARYDNVFIRRKPGWELQRNVVVTGEVQFPGRYSLQSKAERFLSVIERAGGLTGEAYAAGVRFSASATGRAGSESICPGC